MAKLGQTGQKGPICKKWTKFDKTSKIGQLSPKVAKNGPPPFTDKIRIVVFDVLPLRRAFKKGESLDFVRTSGPPSPPLRFFSILTDRIFGGVHQLHASKRYCLPICPVCVSTHSCTFPRQIDKFSFGKFCQQVGIR